jgi:hypothetical protein
MTKPGYICLDRWDCPPEAPACVVDATGETKRCVPQPSNIEDGGSTTPTSVQRPCQADWECNQAVGDACCLVPSYSSLGASLPPVGGRLDFCNESQKNSCYQGLICSLSPKQCLGSANPLVCAGCDQKCTPDGFCDRTWEDETCADCQTLCTPCVKNGVPLGCGIDPVCGTGKLCGACASCNPQTFQCDATPDLCRMVCANIQNCAAVQAVYGSTTCNCLPDFACTKGTCSPNGLMCEETTLSIGDSLSKEPCTWCGGTTISASQCLACGGYIQGTKCMALDTTVISPECNSQ